MSSIHGVGDDGGVVFTGDDGGVDGALSESLGVIGDGKSALTACRHLVAIVRADRRCSTTDFDAGGRTVATMVLRLHTPSGQMCDAAHASLQ